MEKSHGKMVNAGMVKGTNKKCYRRKGVTHSGEIEGTSALVRPVGPMSFLVTTFGSIITKARPKELQMHYQNTLRKSSLLVISTFSSNSISSLRLIPLHQVLVCGTHVLHQLRQAIQQPSSSDRINEAYHAYMELSGSIMRLWNHWQRSIRITLSSHVPNFVWVQSSVLPIDRGSVSPPVAFDSYSTCLSSTLPVAVRFLSPSIDQLKQDSPTDINNNQLLLLQLPRWSITPDPVLGHEPSYRTFRLMDHSWSLVSASLTSTNHLPYITKY